MRGFSEQPKFSTPLEYDGDIYKCPETGVIIPKQEENNLIWREKFLREAEKDPVLRKDLLSAAKASVINYINMFVWTYHQKWVDSKTHEEIPAEIVDHPFVTWPIQDKLLKKLMQCYKKGKDLLVHKSRDIGASWLCLAFLHWLWIFEPSTEIRIMSRKESLVDGDADSLLWKLDYMNRFLPEWIRPPNVMMRGRKNRYKLHVVNEKNNSTIAGEATTAVSLSGGRAKILLLDEFAKVENGNEIRSATRDVAPCRIVNSTSFGAGTEYARWKSSGKIEVFSLMFWDHPEKGKGRYVTKDDLGRFHIRSPWFDIEEKVRDPKHLAQEVLGEDIESGDTVFTISNVDKHITLFAKEPRIRLNVILKKDIPNAKVFQYIRSKDVKAIDFRKVKEGKLRVWGNLILGRPDQSKCYIFGIDISKGQGASESVVSIKCKETGEKIARWSDANTPPYAFARIVIALALWCGGAKPIGLPFLKWEKNGDPGIDFGRIVVTEFHYPFYYSYQRPGTTAGPKPGDASRYGWHSSRDSKGELMGLYNEKLAHGGYINPDEQGLEQAKEYIHYPGGGCGPAVLVRASNSERALHGDIVIADALTLEDDKLPKAETPKSIIPENTFAFRKKKFLSKKKRAKSKTWREVVKL